MKFVLTFITSCTTTSIISLIVVFFVLLLVTFTRFSIPFNLHAAVLGNTSFPSV